MRQNSQKAFMLLEMTIVIAIIGLLTSVIGLGFANAKMRARDASRLQDMQQIKTGLDLYFTTAAGYPDEDVWNSGLIGCNGQALLKVPVDPSLGAPYEYETRRSLGTSCGGPVWREYYVQFTMEGKSDLGDPGIYYLSTKGFTRTVPF